MFEQIASNGPQESAGASNRRFLQAPSLSSINLFAFTSGAAVVSVRGKHIVAENITKQKLAERERSLLATIVESSEDAIIGRKLDGKIISWNAGAKRIFGYADKEAIGRLYSFLVPADRVNELKAILKKLKRGKRVEHYESVRLAKCGKRVDISLTVSPIKDERGVLLGFSTIGRDIGARKRGEAERNRLVRQLGERVKELTTMYAVAHLLQMEKKSTGMLLQEIIALLPPTWQ
ncbi:MAG: PAS domain-containing protein, partial [Limisphaerales bacterium]